jgi:hypothetical protein
MPERDRAIQAERIHAEREHGRAVQRLKTARSQQGRLRDEHEAAKGTGDELTLCAALRVADDEVVARERWLESVDDHHY